MKLTKTLINGKIYKIEFTGIPKDKQQSFVKMFKEIKNDELYSLDKLRHGVYLQNILGDDSEKNIRVGLYIRESKNRVWMRIFVYDKEGEKK